MVTSEDSIPKQAYVMLHKTNISGKQNWVEEVRNFLNAMDYEFVWLNGGVCNENRFKAQLRQIIEDCHQQQWDSKDLTSTGFK